ncbi:MAG TPA: MBL fold metallo-hydrolase [Bryobacteraceae bacterium]|nr:MBL fold metallo-hydrolase [Bryobacteraceae bacterium]HPT24935.1 MBL fold metallo-hydrolase [Bryobacteraceae bacterium]
MKLTFWGAAQTVTGSMHEVKVQGRRYLLDCGLYQGRRFEARTRNSKFPWPATAVDGVILSHAHIDHSGNLPSLTKNGYQGPVFATPATIDLCAAMLPDSAHVQEKDALFLAKRKHRRRSLGEDDPTEIAEPLYSAEDAEATIPLMKPVPIGEVFEAGPGFTCRTFDAGHMLGSSCIHMELEHQGKRRSVIFSGDVGRKNLPIIRDPDEAPPADYLIMESTYGDRLHQDASGVEGKLADVINRTAKRGGRVICPAFAVGRTQQLVLLLHQLSEAGRIPKLPVFVDSPLAVNVTGVFQSRIECYDQETASFISNGKDPFSFPNLRYIKDVAESKALNDLRSPCIIISASGMCEFGRILHHLRNNIENPHNTVLITGFQAEHTLGRKIVDKQPEVTIFGEPMRLRAEVVKLNELSGHADQSELLAWMKPITPRLKKIFLVHGEPRQSQALAQAIRSIYGIETIIPSRSDTVTFD